MKIASPFKGVKPISLSEVGTVPYFIKWYSEYWKVSNYHTNDKEQHECSFSNAIATCALVHMGFFLFSFS